MIRWYDQACSTCVGTHKFEGCLQSSADQIYAANCTRGTFVSSMHEVGVMLCRVGGQRVSTK